MLPKLDTFVLLANEGPSMDKKDEPWSKFKHGDDGMRKGNKNGVSSGVSALWTHHDDVQVHRRNIQDATS